MQIPVFDALGNLTELRREDGALIERYEYTPFGDRSVYLETSLPCQALTGSLAANHIRFHDLLYARNRYYDPDMGRFVTTDPLGSVDGPNLYQFVGNDPVNGRDPLGLYDLRGYGDGGHERWQRLAAMSPIEREALLVEEWRRDREFNRGARIAISIGAGFVPVLGEIHDGSQLLTGYYWIAGEHLTLGDRAASGAAFFVPLAGASLVRYGKKSIEGVQSLWRSTFGGPRLFEGVDEAIIAGARVAVEGLVVRLPSRGAQAGYWLGRVIPVRHHLSVSKHRNIALAAGKVDGTC